MTRGIEPDLVDCIFGHLKVLSRADSDKQGNAKWLCNCDCGNQVEVRASFLIKGQICCSKQCKFNPAKSIKDITGRRFGELVAVKHVGFYKSRQAVWEFQCSCGNVVRTSASNVLHNDRKSCGKGIHASAYKHGLAGTRGYKSHHYAKYEATKKQRTPAWLTKDDMGKIAEVYAEAAKLSSNGERFEVDHFYPLQGKKVSGLHVPSNLRIVHRSVNRKKSNLHPDDVC
jgi:hypothetical protein